MKRVTITSTGQMTIPIQLRRQLNIQRGDPFTITILDQDRFAATRVRAGRRGPRHA